MSEEKKSNGFVALYRSVRDDWMFPTSEERFTRFEAFCDLLMMAQGKPEGRRIKRGSRTIELARGEAAINLTRLGERWGRGRKWVRNFIKTGEQAKTWVQRKPDGVPNGTTIISFVNYDTYNPLRSGQDPTETPTQGQQKTQRGHNGGTTGAQRGADQQGNKETKEQGNKENHRPTLGQSIMENGGFDFAALDAQGSRVQAMRSAWAEGFVLRLGRGPTAPVHDKVAVALSQGPWSSQELAYSVANWLDRTPPEERDPWLFIRESEKWYSLGLLSMQQRGIE